MKAWLITSIVLTTLAPVSAFGQTEYAPTPYGYLGSSAYYGGYGGYGYHSSTVEEGAARGVADVIRARGIYNQLTADAIVRLEEGRRRYIENYKQAVDTYFQIRDQYKARRDDEYYRQRQNRERRLQNRRTDVPRLSNDQLDRETGVIMWPEVLMDDAFKRQRFQFDELSSKRAERGLILTIADREMVQHAKNGVRGVLRERSQELRSSDTILALRFVEALTNEVRFATNTRN